MQLPQYFTQLSREWQQLDTFEGHKWECTNNAATYKKKIVEMKRVFKFFLGLNKQVDEVCGRILAIKPLHTLEKSLQK